MNSPIASTTLRRQTTLSYDGNGNLTNADDGHYAYVYDDENRLVQWNYYQTGTPGSDGDLATAFDYDGMGRLRQRIEYVYSVGLGDWVPTSQVHYVYDGRRVIEERDGDNTPLVSYTRGNDLSGTLEGAGGIGGLLARSDGYSGGNWSTHNYYHADGNGNITYLVDSSQALAASYRYDPFGNTISQGGSLASANVYRFSLCKTQQLYPPGRGRIIRRLFECCESELAGHALETMETVERCPLSSGMRAGV